jgi:hypothetical protein
MIVYRTFVRISLEIGEHFRKLSEDIKIGTRQLSNQQQIFNTNTGKTNYQIFKIETSINEHSPTKQRHNNIQAAWHFNGNDFNSLKKKLLLKIQKKQHYFR